MLHENNLTFFYDGQGIRMRRGKMRIHSGYIGLSSNSQNIVVDNPKKGIFKNGIFLFKAIVNSIINTMPKITQAILALRLHLLGHKAPLRIPWSLDLGGIEGSGVLQLQEPQ
jgi:hypothetical protein